MKFTRHIHIYKDQLTESFCWFSFRNIPRSILISVPIITALYVFMNFSYLIVLTPDEMKYSTAVAVTFGMRVLGPYAFIIPLGVAVATFGCALSIQFSVTRLCYVAGREGHFLAPMSYIHHERLTPGPAVALQVYSIGKYSTRLSLTLNFHFHISGNDFTHFYFYGRC